MEREIKQDFTITWKLMWAFAGLVIVLMLVCFSLGYSVTHNWRDLAYGAGVSVFIVVFTRMCLRSGLQQLESSPKKWWLTDQGLERVYDSENHETIRWEQIQYLRWVRYNGLIVRWNEQKSDHRGRKFREEFKYDWVYRQFKTTLRVQKDEAAGIISMCQRMNPKAEIQFNGIPAQQ